MKKVCHGDTLDNERRTTMNMWLERNRRYCDRQTAIELGGEEYRNTEIHTILYFDEYITIVDEVCHGDTPENE